MQLSIVVPCYCSEQSIRKVVEETKTVLDGLQGWEYEFVLVDDCSPDNTYKEIRALSQEYPFVHGVSLMRNFGQHNALMCALNHATGDYILGMDDDLQTHPSQIPLLIEKMEEGYDVVYGVYESSENGRVKNFTSWLNRVSADILLGRSGDDQTSNFWMITKQLKDEVIKYRNYNPYIQALFGRMTNHIGNVQIEHHKRDVGESNYTLKKLIKLWLAYFNYTVLPLRFASAVGALTATIGLLAGVGIIIYRIVDPTILLGWSSVICVLLFFFGLILLVLGIIGEYLGDLVLSSNSTPQYVERDETGL